MKNSKNDSRRRRRGDGKLLGQRNGGRKERAFRSRGRKLAKAIVLVESRELKNEFGSSLISLNVKRLPQRVKDGDRYL